MRCAVYTRVSTDEQALSEYSSLRRREDSDLEVSGSATRIRTWNLPVNSRPLYR